MVWRFSLQIIHLLSKVGAVAAAGRRGKRRHEYWWSTGGLASSWRFGSQQVVWLAAGHLTSTAEAHSLVRALSRCSPSLGSLLAGALSCRSPLIANLCSLSSSAVTRWLVVSLTVRRYSLFR